MDMNTPTTGQEENRFPTTPAPRSGNIGPLAAAVIIVLVLAAGGYYFLRNEQQKQTDVQGPEVENSTATAQPDTADSIEADLDATATGGADQDVSNLDSAL